MIDVPSTLRIHLLTHATKQWPKSGVHLTKALFQFIELQRLIVKNRYRVVHFFGGPKTGLVAAFIKMMNPNTRIIYSPISAPKVRSVRSFYRNLDLIVSTTQFVSDEWARIVGKEKVDVIKPGVLKDMKQPGVGVVRDSVVFWRNADYDNGADLMLSAVKELAPRHPLIKFVFAIRAGSEFENAAINLDREFNNVVTQVHPYRDGLSIEDILSHALFVVAPFRHLSINPQMSILETLYAGVPLIASDVESNREVVVEGVTGLLIGQGSPEYIVAAVDRLLGDAMLLATLTSNAESKTSASFNWTDFTARLSKIYGT